MAEDESGKMIELDAEQVLTFPKAIVAKEVVNRGFVTNLLFVNINNVFNIPSEVIAALNKAPSTSDTDKQTKGEEVQHDPDRKKNRDHRISVNKDKLLGNKVYTSRMQDIVLSAVDSDMEADEIVEKITADCMPEISEVLGKYKDFYSPSKTELDNIKNGLREKVKEAAEEFVSGDIADRMAQDKLADSLANIIEKDLPNDTVIREEEDNYEKEEKSEMDQIRRKLRTFTRAIPSFIMAASKDVDEITLDNIEDTVSDKDFEELFTEKDSEPFTKDDFRKIRGPWTNPETGETFEGFFDRYTFNAAIREFEEKRQEIADYLSPGAKEDIFSYIRPLKTNQIFTPRGVVNKMLDLLEENNPGIFEDPNATFADLYVKSGLYLTEIAKRLNRGLESKIPDKSERVKHILEKQLYGFAPTNIIYNIARKYIYGTFSDIDNNNLKQLDLTDAFKKGETLNMKFTAVVGNPPYQDETLGDNKGFAPPIYDKFIDASYRLSDKALLIHPARFLFNAGSTPKDWNQKMLNDEHLKVLYFEQDSSKVFSNTDIKGGIAITYHDNNESFGAIKIFTSFVELQTIMQKASPSEHNSLMNIIYIQNKFDLDKLYSAHPEYRSVIGSDGKDKRFRNNIFDKVNLFTNKPSNDDDIKVIGIQNNKRTWKYFPKAFMDLDHENLEKWKVLLPRANGSGAIGEVLSTPLIGYTQSFIGIGAFGAKNEAEAALKYVKSKFCRTMLGILKITQDNNRDTWRLVPVQDFTNNSDIDWSKSIEEIDKQLYRKYNLSDKEIAFIEEKVRPME